MTHCYRLLLLAVFGVLSHALLAQTGHINRHYELPGFYQSTGVFPRPDGYLITAKGKLTEESDSAHLLLLEVDLAGEIVSEKRHAFINRQALDTFSMRVEPAANSGYVVATSVSSDTGEHAALLRLSPAGDLL